MKKPILATALKGIIIKNSPWIDAHFLWYEDREKELIEKELDTTPIKEWRKLLEENPREEKERYFDYVDEVMKRLYPELSEKERTSKARSSFFDSVIKYMKLNPNVVNRSVLNYLESLKEKYRLALITSNTQSALEKILNSINLPIDFFDFIETSRPEEKDDKRKVFDRFIQKQGKPKLYIGTGKESLNYCRENEIPCVYANFEGEEEIRGVTSVHNLTGLKKELKKLI